MRIYAGFVIVLVLLFWQCQSQENTITGQIEGTAGSGQTFTLYLIQPENWGDVATSYMGTVVDSVILPPEGTFAFSHLPDAPDPVLLQLVLQPSGTRFANQLDNEDLEAANYCPLIWQNGQGIRLQAHAKALQASLQMKNPTPANQSLLELRDIRLEAYRNWKNGETPGGDAHQEEFLLAQEAALRDFQQPLLEFARQTNQLLPALQAIRWVSPEGDYERVPEFLVQQCKKWKSLAPEHPWVQQLCAKADPEQLPVLQESPFPDSRLPLSSGDTSHLYSLLGTKLTLVDLWASWCAPCRRENREVLVPLWDRYHEKGFQIIAYGLEGNAAAWNNAIQNDGAYRWLHASHLQGDTGPFLDLLRVQTIPANFLLDSSGVVVAKNLHGEALVTYVEGFMRRE